MEYLHFKVVAPFFIPGLQKKASACLYANLKSYNNLFNIFGVKLKAFTSKC